MPTAVAAGRAGGHRARVKPVVVAGRVELLAPRLLDGIIQVVTNVKLLLQFGLAVWTHLARVRVRQFCDPERER